VILGDFNSDLSIANNNTLIETMMMFNLVNIISKPTRITDYSNTLLVPIISSDTINYISWLKYTPLPIREIFW
jgi:hypothetical protein